MSVVKSISKMSISEILWALRDYIDGQVFNLGIAEDNNEYIPIVLDEVPDYDFKRAIVLENSDIDCFGWDDDREYMSLIISCWFNPEEINRGGGLEKPFSHKDAQSETRSLLRNFRYQSPHPITGRMQSRTGKMQPQTVTRIMTEDDLICYSLPFKVYIS